MKMFKNAKKGFTLVELMIVVAIIGILAAIAIPAFLRYIKNSKTAEAEQTMKKAAEGAKAYFTSEQRYTLADGDQPWHSADGNSSLTNTMAGMPVPWSSYVFPGGSSMTICSHTGATACGTTVPQGGSKLLPPPGLFAAGEDGAATLNKLRVSFQDPTYFSYEYQSSGAGGNARADIFAYANFIAADEVYHTVSQYVLVQAATQEPVIAPATTQNEFE